MALERKIDVHQLVAALASLERPLRVQLPPARWPQPQPAQQASDGWQQPSGYQQG